MQWLISCTLSATILRWTWHELYQLHYPSVISWTLRSTQSSNVYDSCNHKQVEPTIRHKPWAQNYSSCLKLTTTSSPDPPSNKTAINKMINHVLISYLFLWPINYARSSPIFHLKITKGKQKFPLIEKPPRTSMGLF